MGTYSKSTMTSRLTTDMVAEAKELLRLMGLPVVQAASEAEAQADGNSFQVRGAAPPLCR